MSGANTFDLQCEDVEKAISEVTYLSELMGKVCWSLSVLNSISENKLAIGDSIQKSLEKIAEFHDSAMKAKTQFDEVLDSLQSFKSKQQDAEDSMVW